MPRITKLVRVGPLTFALTAWDVWRRLPPRQRRWVLAQAREHGPKLARRAYQAQKTARRR